jgi:hypothetical protein
VGHLTTRSLPIPQRDPTQTLRRISLHNIQRQRWHDLLQKASHHLQLGTQLNQVGQGIDALHQQAHIRQVDVRAHFFTVVVRQGLERREVGVGDAARALHAAAAVAGREAAAQTHQGGHHTPLNQRTGRVNCLVQRFHLECRDRLWVGQATVLLIEHGNLVSCRWCFRLEVDVVFVQFNFV